MNPNDKRNPTQPARAPVSFAGEELILVDSDDEAVSFCSKVEAHHGAGQLHRAFSVFLFDEQQRLLVHRRSEQKPLWPGFWTNSCCSHPRRGETLEQAVLRRIVEELGVHAAATRVYSFEYRAEFQDRGTEHELCHVFLASAPGAVAIKAHADEVMDWCWLTVDDVDQWMATRSEELTPWFQMEWRALRGAHGAALDAYLRDLAARRDVA